MIPTQGCFYLGAYRAFSSFRDAFLLIHSVSGCSWGALAFHQMGRQDDVRQACTMIHENEVVFGGEDKLASGLEILKSHRPQRVFVLNGCPADMIKDDIQSVIDEAGCPFPVHWMDTAGYMGSAREGFISAMRYMAKLAEKPEDAGARADRAVPSVNLIGIALDDPRSDADTEAIRRMLEPKVRLNACLPMLTEESLKRFADADLNLVLKGFEPVGEDLRERLGMPYIAVDYPYGAAGSAEFLKEVDRALGTDHGAEIEEGLARAAKAAEKALHPLRLLYQAEAAVAGDFARASAMKRFLRDEAGFRISAYRDDLDPHEDQSLWLDRVRDSGTTVVFGSSFERCAEDEMPAKLIRFSYPVTDEIRLGYQPYAGFDGLDFLLSDILSGVLSFPYRREGQFQPREF
ncbi:MAG: nitrogenase component 1 [Firmicutes bacterium]|nr:nitrogenase component 1 [Bacillota bacterium]